MSELSRPTPVAQLAKLRASAKYAKVPYALVTGTLILAGSAYISGHALLYVIAVFVGFAALESMQLSAHISRAIAAMNVGGSVKGIVTIVATPQDGQVAYSATVKVGVDAWEIGFSPLAGKATPGTFDADIFLGRDVAWPVLVQTDYDFLHPTSVRTVRKGG